MSIYGPGFTVTPCDDDGLLVFGPHRVAEVCCGPLLPVYGSVPADYDPLATQKKYVTESIHGPTTLANATFRYDLFDTQKKYVTENIHGPTKLANGTFGCDLFDTQRKYATGNIHGPTSTAKLVNGRILYYHGHAVSFYPAPAGRHGECARHDLRRDAQSVKEGHEAGACK